MRRPNTTLDIYLNGATPPAAPDVQGQSGYLKEQFAQGSATNEGSDRTFFWTGTLEVPLDVNLPDGYPSGLFSTTVYVPNSDGVPYTVVFVERERDFRGRDFKRAYLVKGLVGLSVSITVEEVDGAPSYTATTKLQFDQADGFLVSQPAANTVRVDHTDATSTQRGIVNTVLQGYGGRKLFNADGTDSSAAGVSAPNFQVYQADVNLDEDMPWEVFLPRTEIQTHVGLAFGTGAGGSEAYCYVYQGKTEADAFTWNYRWLAFDVYSAAADSMKITAYLRTPDSGTASPANHGEAGFILAGGAYQYHDGTDCHVGATATVSGLVFKAGLYISGSFSGGSGTVTTVSVASANGFAGSVATATTTPALTLTTTVTGMLKGNGTAISAATASDLPDFDGLNTATIVDGDQIPFADVSVPANRKTSALALQNYLLPSGLIMQYGGSTVPSGWLECDGSAVSRTTYANLFTALGTTWGSGDGSTTFNLPDLRGRGLIGAGTGSGLTARTLGGTGGSETHTLATSEIPAHDHQVKSAAGLTLYEIGGGSTLDVMLTTTFATNGTVWTTENAGSGGSHNNMPPWAAVKHIIKT